MRKVFPVLLAVVGLAIGGGVGWFLRPSNGDVETTDGNDATSPTNIEQPDATGPANEETDDHSEPTEFVKLGNQFIVPIVVDGRVSAMVVLSLNLEVKGGTTEQAFAVEPKLRDRFLQILFDHANAGGFSGTFTDGANLIVLRRSLFEAAQMVMGEAVLDVLISDFGRQDS